MALGKAASGGGRSPPWGMRGAGEGPCLPGRGLPEGPWSLLRPPPPGTGSPRKGRRGEGVLSATLPPWPRRSLAPASCCVPPNTVPPRSRCPCAWCASLDARREHPSEGPCLSTGPGQQGQINGMINGNCLQGHLLDSQTPRPFRNKTSQQVACDPAAGPASG